MCQVIKVRWLTDFGGRSMDFVEFKYASKLVILERIWNPFRRKEGLIYSFEVKWLHG